MSQQKITISVIGGHDISAEQEKLAYQVGQMVAELGCVLVCGGLLGAMQAACHGAKDAGGLTIGILPGKEKADANAYVDIALPTTLGFARNVIVAASADIIIALAGSHGTSSEISYGIVYKRPIIDMGNWQKEKMIPAADINEARQKIEELIKQIKSERETK